MMTARRSGPTRQRILDAALDLFNRDGAAGVTTHDIAAACAISPGNLYYHFRNKEEIVRALFDQAIAQHRRRQAETGGAPGPDHGGALEFLKEFNWRYRFFKRELPTLLQRDRSLRAAFLAFQQEHLDRFRAEVGEAVARGALRALSVPDQRKLAEISWLILLFWPAYVELDGRLTRAGMDRGVELVDWLFTVLVGRSSEAETASAAPKAHAR